MPGMPRKYNSKVLVTGWVNNQLALPYDNTNPTLLESESHYKFLGTSTQVDIPITTAQEAMENGCYKQLPDKNPLHRSKVNFTTFRMWNESIEQYLKKNKISIVEPKLLSTYGKDFTSPNPNFKKKINCCIKADLPHPLFNCRPKNEFLMAGPSAPGKFMDSHFYDISPNRKCINQFRQIRNSSTIFY